MATLTRKLLSGFAAVCATAISSSAGHPGAAQDLLELARSQASQTTACKPSAEDAAAAATLRILERHPEVLEFSEDHRRSYVERSVRNALHDDYRRRSRLRGFDDLASNHGPDARSLELDVPARSAGGLELAAIAEFRGRLSPEDAEVLGLLEEGCREREIAEHTGQTRHQVRGSVARLRRNAERHFGLPLASD